MGQPAVGPAVVAGALEARACTSSRTSASPTYAELGPGGVLTGMAKRTVDGARTISVATPEELDKLHRVGRAGDRRRGPARLEGEHLFASERLVVSPAAGIFTPRRGHRRRRRRSRSAPCSATSASTRCARRSPASLQSYIAVDTERVTARQPIAWLRTQLSRTEGAPPCLPSDRAPAAP